MIDFKEGDVVRLKSGGEKMTIQYLDFPSAGEHKCIWFENKKQYVGNFSPSVLIKISGDKENM